MMNQNELVRLVNEMISAPSCCKELQEAGRNWLSATDPEMKKAATAALLQEIREDVPPIEDVIAFFESPQGIQAFGRNAPRPLPLTPAKSRHGGESGATVPPAPPDGRFWKALHFRHKVPPVPSPPPATAA